jgi:hypothetical protein
VSPVRARRTALRTACAVLAAVVPWPARAQGQGQGLGLARESAVKAAFLLKFGSFVEWPPGSFRAAAAPFVIAVYGDDAVAAELEQLAQGREVEGHPVTILRVRDSDDLAGVHVLFAGGPHEARARDVLAAARGPVLTVADASIGRPAAVLAFTQDQSRVRFNASLTAAAVRGLRLSAKLLAVAQQVEGR